MLANLKKNNLINDIYKDTSNTKELASFLGIDLEKLPAHIAFIMDGNGRWANKRGEKRTSGHRAGVKTLRNLVKAFRLLNIPVITVYAFSTENWKRTPEEVDFLMKLFEESIMKEARALKEKGVRVKFIGRISELRESLQEKIRWIEEETASEKDLIFNIAINYGGRSEILDAVKSISEEVKKGNISENDIDEKLFSEHLYTAGQPDPDLIIRTSGEYRISNYLLWQLAYSEIWVTETCWPDFAIPEFLEAIYQFQQRDRRFGQTK